MSDTKKAPGELDLKAVSVTPTPVAVTADMVLQLPDGKVLKGKELIELAASGFDTGRPPDDGPCGNFWCTRMGSPMSDWLAKVNPADLAVLIRLGIIEKAVLTKEQLAALETIRKQ